MIYPYYRALLSLESLLVLQKESCMHRVLNEVYLYNHRWVQFCATNLMTVINQ